ncbi:hypothetical protein HHK36_022288 [Tetracentron sinense]|uniref:J domain-containing protein n=1 Tax=Tetracentron sinense TaxID=13715 RepID=A0A835D657_TETSI|nr:hypothetical protein HHK36_022288 [Tetracentron sinense]
MSYGLISGSDSRFYLCKKPNFSTRKWKDESCICVCFNTHLPKTSFLIQNRSSSFRTQAAINDGFVTEAPEMSFYELLGISESGTFSEIKQAYKQLALKYHPDVSPPDRTEEYTRRFIQVQEAYEILSDPRMRALYDKDLSMGLHLAFSARKRYQNDEVLEERGEWKNRWQSQLTELKRRRSMNMDSRGNMSWAARMRNQRNQSSTE